MSAESSPESGEMPEWVQRNVEWARTWPREHKGSPVIDTIATITWLADALSTVQERAERAERDAARYRYVRDAITLTTRMPMLINGHKCSALLVTGEQYDAAIDAAIESSTPIPEGADRAE